MAIQAATVEKHPESAMEQGERLAKLERDVAHLQTDVTEVKGDVSELRRENISNFRWLLGVLILLFSAICTGYVSLNARLIESAKDMTTRQDKILQEVHSLAVDAARGRRTP